MRAGPPGWLRQRWLAMTLQGRLVAGYTILFAFLLAAILAGEATVVRQVLVDDRLAALPSSVQAVVSSLQSSPLRVGQGPEAGALPASIPGNSETVIALFAADGSLLSEQTGADVDGLNPARLLDARYARGKAVF